MCCISCFADLVFRSLVKDLPVLVQLLHDNSCINVILMIIRLTEFRLSACCLVIAAGVPVLVSQALCRQLLGLVQMILL